MELEANFEILHRIFEEWEYFKYIKNSFSLPEVKEATFYQASKVTK